MSLTSEDVQAIAQAVVDKLATPQASDPWLTREEAAKYLNVSRSSFARLRETETRFLKPVCENPLRFSRSQLQLFQASKNKALLRTK